MKICRFLPLLASLFNGYALADCELEELGKSISASSTLFRFEQTKTVEYLSNPLVSAGLIWNAPEGQLVWQVRTPIKSTTVIGSDQIMEFNRRDEPKSSIEIDIAYEISEIFLNVLDGNFAALSNAFDQTLECSDAQWQLRLVPSSSRISDLLDYLTIEGEGEIQSIEYVERRGDRTRINLSLISDDYDDLTAGLDHYLTAFDNAPP